MCIIQFNVIPDSDLQEYQKFRFRPLNLKPLFASLSIIASSQVISPLSKSSSKRKLKKGARGKGDAIGWRLWKP